MKSWVPYFCIAVYCPPQFTAELSYHYALCLSEHTRHDEAQSVLKGLLSRSALLQRSDRIWVGNAKTLLKKIS